MIEIGDTLGDVEIVKKLDDMHYLCRCSCGNDTVVHIENLMDGSITNCGHIPNTVINITGNKFGKWYIDSYAGQRKWNVVCECGKEDVKDGGKLRNGYTNSCKACSRLIDITGNTYGDLVVIKYAGNRKWLCKCSCENMVVVNGRDLKSGHTKSCGHATTGFKNLKGESFGELIVTDYTGDGIWKCKCKACGNEARVHRTRLLRGSTKSCGCKTNTFRKITMFERYGDIHSTHIGNPRELDQIEALGNRDKLISLIDSFDHKPDISEICYELGVQKSAALKAIHRLGLEDKVVIGSTTSRFEHEIVRILKEIDETIDIITNDRSILNGKELDIYIPSKKIAIEFNGTFYHSTEFKGELYHQYKTLACRELGIQLIHIFEYEWTNKDEQNKIVELLRSKLANKKVVVNCDVFVREIEDDECKQFIATYGIYGNASGSIRLGAIKNNSVIGVLVADRDEEGSEKYEIISLACCTTVDTNSVTDKLYQYFIDKYKPKSVYGYVDASKFTGEELINLGFKLEDITTPKFVWVEAEGPKIIRDTSGKNFDNSKYFKVFDCGNYKFCNQNI